MLIVPDKKNKITQISTNLIDENYPTWDKDTEYSFDEIVIYGNFIYSSLADSNINNTPDITPIKWKIVKPVNSYAFLDDFNGTQSVSNEDIEILLDISDVDTIGFFGLYGQELYIRATNKTNNLVFFEKTYTLTYLEISDWWENMFADEKIKKKLILNLFPTYNTEIYIKIKKWNGEARIGNIVMGMGKKLGCVQSKVKIGVRSSAKKERKKTGRFVIDSGKRYDKLEIPIFIENGKYRYVKNILEEIDGIATLFVAGTSLNENTPFAFGFYLDLDMDFGLNVTDYTLLIEGVT